MHVCEIFSSIQGESSYAGLTCTFVRLSGCNLRCTYCDTKYSYAQGTEMSVEGIVEAVAAKGIGLVEVTGGEPLLQDETPELIDRLLEQGYEVLIETNGSVDIKAINKKAIFILDVKTPGSGMASGVCIDNFGFLKPTDEIKFVICSRGDYEWSKDFVMKYALDKNSKVLFSAALGELEPSVLARWMVQDRLNARLNIQVHKYIFGPDERMV